MNAYQHALHPERLLVPIAKVGGRFVRVRWEEALSLIAERIISIQKEMESMRLLFTAADP